MASLKKLLSDSVIYGLSSIVGRFLNYLLVPVYTYHISAASGGYGVVTNVYAYTALLLVILTFGMETTFFYYANREGADRRRVFCTALGAVGAVCLLFATLVMVFIAPISTAMGYGDHPEYIRAMGLVVALDAFQAILFDRLRLDGRPWKFFALKIGFILLTVALTLFIFLVAPHWSHLSWMAWYDEANNVKYIFYINLFCTAIITFGFAKELKDFHLSLFDFHLLKNMLKYAWPLLLFGIVGIFNQVADKILLPKLLPGEEGNVQLGIYGACVKIAMIMAMITQAFRYAYEPFVFGGKQDKEDKTSQAKVMKYFIIFTLFAFLAVVMYMPILKHIIKSDYWEGLRVIPIVMMAEIFMGIYFNLSFWYKLIDQTWWGAIFSAIGCLVLLAINFIFVPRYGYMACAWGGFAGYGTCMVLSYLVGQKKAPIPYDLKSAFLYFALAVVLFFAQSYIHLDNTVWTLVVNTALMLVFVAFICVMERDLIKGVTGVVKTKLLKRKP